MSAYLLDRIEREDREARPLARLRAWLREAERRRPFAFPITLILILDATLAVAFAY